MKKIFVIISIIVLFLSFLFLLNWNSFNSPFERDEGEYAYSAWLLKTGDLPYENSFLQKPPLIIYTYLIAQIINPFSLWPPRMIAFVFVVITGFLIYLIAKKEWGSFAGVFSAFLFIPLISFPPITPFAANTEKFMILPLTAIIFLFVYFKNCTKIWPYVLAGVFSSLAVFYKPICLPIIIFIMFYWFFTLYKENKNISFIKVPLISFILSGVLTSVIIIIPFIGVIDKLIEEVFVFNISYTRAFGSPFLNFSNYFLKFFKYWWILIIFIFGLLIKKPKDFIYFSCLLIIGILTIFSSPIGHYYIMIMPLLSIFLGALFSSLISKMTHKNKLLFSLTVIPLVFYMMVFPFGIQLSLNPNELSKWVYGTVNPFVEAKEVAKQISSMTNNDDNIFIAGSEPEIYFYSKRKANTRFIITYPLNLLTPYREKYQNELVKDISKELPKIIVVSNRVYSGLWNEGSPTIFISYLNKIIKEKYDIKGGYIWDTEDSGHWQESSNSSIIDNASLLVFIKK